MSPIALAGASVAAGPDTTGVLTGFGVRAVAPAAPAGGLRGAQGSSCGSVAELLERRELTYPTWVWASAVTVVEKQ